MGDGDVVFIDEGRAFAADDIIWWADREHRGLGEALATAEVLVSCPHATAEIPGELAEWIAPGLTRRLQFDFSDVTTRAIARRWAEIDPSILYVENPHPRFLRDPNRARPDRVADQLREALRRVRAAGGGPVDLAGVDAIRPVTFGGIAVLTVPESDTGIDRLVETFLAVGERGVDVYQRARRDLVARLLESRPASPMLPVTTVSFHDTMNHIAGPDGALDHPRAPQDRLPRVVTLSNRGDAAGNPRTQEPTVTIDPERLRVLADSHRTGFGVCHHDEIALNRPYLGGDEIVSAAREFGLGHVPGLDAVQAEFSREYLLGTSATAELTVPGDGWPETDVERVEKIARRLRKSWAHYRATAG